MRNMLFLILAFFEMGISCAENPDRPEKQIPDSPGQTIDLKDFELIFSDEFNGKKMDWSVWEADDVRNVKHETSRGREAVSVEEGQLRLNLKRVNRPGNVRWIAGYVFMRQPLEHNVYIETRFKSAPCTGVNNAFWLACKTLPNNTWQNKYEVDIVEARKDARSGKGKAHLAWHDWKTYSYTLNAAGKKMDIAQGIQVEHDFEEWHVWGLWYGENEMIYYLDGEEKWRGKTHDKYPDQYYTGVGKASAWNPEEEKKAYGRFGQDDWSYQGGYNGDAMHVIFANLPWGESWSPLVEEEAEGTYMAIDYFRIYKPKAMLDTRADVEFDLSGMKSGESLIPLRTPYPLAENGNFYFSLPIRHNKSGEITVTLLNARNEVVGSCRVEASGNLQIDFGGRVSTATAYPARERAGRLVPAQTDLMLIGRITGKSGHEKYDRDALSCCVLSVKEMKNRKEPYFYPNIDDEGNTSVGNEWTLNRKAYSDETVTAVSVKISGEWKIGTLKAAASFEAIR